MWKFSFILKGFIIIFLISFSFTSSAQVKDTIPLKLFLNEKIDVISVTSTGGILIVNGYQSKKFVTRNVLLNPSEVLAIGKKSFIPHLSIITIPFKVRNSIDTFPQNVQTGLTNVGLGVNFYNYRLSRYFASGSKSNHVFGLGFIFAPTAEELTPDNTRNYVNKKSKQLFISTCVSMTYSYNEITLAIVPAGFDFATTKDGTYYIYDKKLWWGLGIGISTKLLGLF